MLRVRSLVRSDWFASSMLLAYASLLLTIWGLLYFLSDRWWLATVVLFAPRWPWAIPWPFVAIVALRRNWYLRGGLIFVTWILLFAILDVQIGAIGSGGRAGGSIRILTLNVGGREFDLKKLDRLVVRTEPDVVALQECPGKLEVAALTGWHEIRLGDNLIASRWPITPVDEVRRKFPADRWPRPICGIVRVACPERDFEFATVHLQSPRESLSGITSARTVIRLSGRHALAKQSHDRRLENEQVHDRLIVSPGPLIIAGDFNTPVDSTIYRSNWRKFSNAFSVAGWGFGNTVQVMAGGHRFRARIDHILMSEHWQTVACWVGEDLGSDHFPVCADLRWVSE